MTDQQRNDVDTIEVTIPADEWSAAWPLTHLIIDDERHATGHIRLRTVEGRRRWTATDRYRTADIEGGADVEGYSILLSLALLHAVHSCIGDAETARLRIEFVDGVASLVSVGTGNSFTTVAVIDPPFPDIDATFELDPDEIAASATVTGSDLYAFVRSRYSRIDAVDDSETDLANPQYWFGIHDGMIHSRIDWNDIGMTLSSLVAENVDGEAGAPTNPTQLESVIGCFRHDDEIKIVIPHDRDRALLFVCSDRRASLMPLLSEIHHLRRGVEEAIEAAIGPLALVRDADGDYPLRRDGLDIWGRITPDSSPVLLQTFAVVLNDVEPTAELFAELNDLNSNLGFARIFAIGGQVLAEVDLVAETVDAAEVITAVERISDVAVRLAPMLQAVFGGRPTEDPRLARFERLAGATVDAELAPGRASIITGEYADPNWQFEGVIHVVSGWNPQGAAHDDDRNIEVNALIAADVIRRGGAVARSRTIFQDRTQESSLVMWEMTRNDAVEFGRRAHRDAILELDQDTLRVISCADDSIIERPRVG
jgi:hypothetical protein